MLYRLKPFACTLGCLWLRNHQYSRAIKRALDLSLAVLGLVAFFPVLLLCGLAIRLTGSRRVFFCQQRVGRHGKVFEILKLTTMSDDAHLNGPKVSQRSDIRTTKVGAIIRAFGFNELPQFVNVLKGEMSIVGPRPEVPEYVMLYPLNVTAKILAVRPGITGLATLKFWHEGSLLEDENDVERMYLEEILPEKIRTELFYVTHWNLWLDLRIMIATVIKTLRGTRLGQPKGGTKEHRSSEVGM